MNSKKEPTKITLIAIIIFLFSFALYFLLTQYVNGDQIYYRRLYEKFSTVTRFSEIFSFSSSLVSSRELVSPIILFLGSYFGFNKDIYVTLLNLILIYTSTVFFRKNKTDWLFIILFIFGFYMLVLYTSAERLKIAFIFLFLSFLLKGWIRYIFFIISFLSHFQMSIFLGAYAIYHYSWALRREIYTIKNITISLIFILILLFILLQSSIANGIVAKFFMYYRDRNIIELINLSLLLISMLPFFLKKDSFYKFSLVAIYFSGITLILGGDRINMISYFFFFMISSIKTKITFSKIECLPLLLINFYFSIKSIFFIKNILLYGDGFHSL